MDAKHFDALARSLPGLARREALGRLLAGGLLAMAPMIHSDARARRKKRRRKKKRKKRCKGDTKQPCGKRCVDLATDPENCGSCGRSCPSGSCLNGTCTCAGEDDCPADACICGVRQEGGQACFAFTEGSEVCTSDADCPRLGSFCPNIGRCTVACRA